MVKLSKFDGGKNIKLQIHDARRTSSRMNSNISTERHYRLTFEVLKAGIENITIALYGGGWKLYFWWAQHNI